MIAAELGPFAATLLIPAFFEGGRTTVDGVHRLHGQPVHETAFARSPERRRAPSTPIKPADIIRLMQKEKKRLYS